MYHLSSVRICILLIVLSTTVFCVPVSFTQVDDVASSYNREIIFETAKKGRRVVGVLAMDSGLYITTYQAHGKRRNSDIYFNGEHIYKGPEETIAQPFAFEDSVLIPNEHGKGVLKAVGIEVTHSIQSKGRWSVAGNTIRGRPWVSFNDKYRGHKFHDTAKIYDAETGELIWDTNVKGMTRSIAEHDGKVWASHNFGENVVVNDAGEKIEGDVVALCSFNGELYGGGGAKVGRSKKKDDRNGKVYRLRGKAWAGIADTECTSIPQMVASDGKLWIVGQNPNRLFYLDKSEQLHLVAEAEPYDHKNMGTFGSAVSVQNGVIYWTHSSYDRGYVEKLIQNNILTTDEH